MFKSIEKLSVNSHHSHIKFNKNQAQRRPTRGLHAGILLPLINKIIEFIRKFNDSILSKCGPWPHLGWPALIKIKLTSIFWFSDEILVKFSLLISFSFLRNIFCFFSFLIFLPFSDTLGCFEVIFPVVAAWYCGPFCLRCWMKQWDNRNDSQVEISEGHFAGLLKTKIHRFSFQKAHETGPHGISSHFVVYY